VSIISTCSINLLANVVFVCVLFSSFPAYIDPSGFSLLHFVGIITPFIFCFDYSLHHVYHLPYLKLNAFGVLCSDRLTLCYKLHLSQGVERPWLTTTSDVSFSNVRVLCRSTVTIKTTGTHDSNMPVGRMFICYSLIII